MMRSNRMYCSLANGSVSSLRAACCVLRAAWLLRSTQDAARSISGGRRREGAIEDVESKIHVGLRDAHRRLHAEHVPVEAALPDENTHLARRLEHVERLLLRRRFRRAVAHQLHAEHEAEAAHVADERVRALQAIEAGAEAGA